MTAQEDNATLEALLRGAINGLVDFSRIIIIRTASNFDRPYAGESDVDNLFYADQGGFEPAIQNIYIAGLLIAKAVLTDWETGRTFSRGFKPGNYIGDIFGSLGNTPDFGPGSISGGNPVNLSTVGTSRRDLYKKEMSPKGVVGRIDGKGMLSAEVARRAQGYGEGKGSVRLGLVRVN
jgi:Purine nucleoside permease (NUP)